MHRSSKLTAVALALAGTVALGACGSSDSSTQSQAGGDTTTTPSSDSSGSTTHGGADVLAEIEKRGKPTVDVPAQPATELEKKDLIEGTGDVVPAGATVTVHYVGVGQASKKEFDSSWSRGQTATFPLSGVIAGWTQGIPGMKVGGRRELVIPGPLAYGASSPTPSIGANETLVFVIDLVGFS